MSSLYRPSVKTPNINIVAKIQQSKRSKKPPCPGKIFEKSFKEFALFNPDARNPAKGTTSDAKNP